MALPLTRRSARRLLQRLQLVTFPGCGGPASVQLEFVPGPHGHDEQADSAAREVTRVVELILEHAEQRPRESLGVIALGLGA